MRSVGVARDRFREDYLRILRAVRFAARFGFVVEPETWAAARANAEGLRWLSAERVRDEWFKGLRTARDLAVFCRLWREVGAAEVWLPELVAGYPGADHAPSRRDPVVLTALVFFGNLAYQNFISKLGPGGKVSLLYLASFALLGAGAWWQRWRPIRRIAARK